jgi:hypothetical protein
MMCGDLEEEDSRFEDQLYARFRLHARELLRRHSAQGSSAPAQDLNAYMDRLFGDALSRCVRDGEQAEGGAYELEAEHIAPDHHGHDLGLHHDHGHGHHHASDHQH